MKHILSLVLFATIIALSSCSIEKRVYQSGYYISGKGSSKDAITIKEKSNSSPRDENIFEQNNIVNKQVSDGYYLFNNTSILLTYLNLIEDINLFI